MLLRPAAEPAWVPTTFLRLELQLEPSLVQRAMIINIVSVR